MEYESATNISRGTDSLVDLYLKEKGSRQCKRLVCGQKGGCLMMENDNEPCYRCNLLAVMRKLERIKRNALKEEQAAQRNHYINSQSTHQSYQNNTGRSPLYSPSQSTVLTVNLSEPQLRRPITSSGTSSPIKLPKFRPNTSVSKTSKVRSAPMTKATTTTTHDNNYHHSEMVFIPSDGSYDSRASTAPIHGKRDDRSNYSVNSGGTTNMFPDPKIPLGGSPSAMNKTDKLLTNATNFLLIEDHDSKSNNGYLEQFDHISPMEISPMMYSPPDLQSLGDGSIDSVEGVSLLSNPTKGGEISRQRTSSTNHTDMNHRTGRLKTSSSRSRSGSPSPLKIALLGDDLTYSWGALCDASLKRYLEGTKQNYSTRKKP